MSIPDAILAMVRAAVPEVAVYDGRVPDDEQSSEPPERYVAVYLDNGLRNAGGVDDRSTHRLFRWQVTSVAPDRGMAAWIASEVADAITDQRPAVAGWSPGLIRHVHSRTPRPDEQVLARPKLVAVDLYRLDAERLPAES